MSVTMAQESLGMEDTWETYRKTMGKQWEIKENLGKPQGKHGKTQEIHRTLVIYPGKVWMTWDLCNLELAFFMFVGLYHPIKLTKCSFVHQLWDLGDVSIVIDYLDK